MPYWPSSRVGAVPQQPSSNNKNKKRTEKLDKKPTININDGKIIFQIPEQLINKIKKQNAVIYSPRSAKEDDEYLLKIENGEIPIALPSTTHLTDGAWNTTENVIKKAPAVPAKSTQWDKMLALYKKFIKENGKKAAKTINDADIRQETMVDVARDWYRNDRAAAEEWIATSGLSEDAVKSITERRDVGRDFGPRGRGR